MAQWLGAYAALAEEPIPIHTTQITLAPRDPTHSSGLWQYGHLCSYPSLPVIKIIIFKTLNIKFVMTIWPKHSNTRYTKTCLCNVSVCIHRSPMISNSSKHKAFQNTDLIYNGISLQ